MPRTPTLAALALTTALAAVPAASAARIRHLDVIEHATTDKTVDLGPRGDSTGDVLTFHNRVFDARNRRVVGSDQGYCVRIDPRGGSYECAWTVLLRRGSLAVSGPFFDRHASTLAVTGGTGRYAGARGAMRLVSRKGGKEYLFAFSFRR